MGSYTFKWENPTRDASNVLVTGSFDGWTKSVTLDKQGKVFQKTVTFPDSVLSSKIYYKFVVDNNWTINESYPHEPDHEGNVNNFLVPADLSNSAPTAPFINSVTPESTTVAAVAAMGKKNNKKNKAANKAPAAAAEAKPVDAPVAAAAPVEAQPAETVAAVAEPPRDATATPSDVPGGFPVTPLNEANDLEDKTVSVNPLPATAGTGNPITLAPGEKIPESITAQNINEHVKLDKESYEKSDALPTAPFAGTELPPVSGTMIPESSLPMGGGMTDVNDPTISSVGPTSTTAALAGQVPKEPKAQVPEVVKDSQEKANAAPEASAIPQEVQEKAQVEQELKGKVPEAPATSVGTSGVGTEKKENTGAVVGAATATGGAAVAAAVAAVNKFSGDAAPVAGDKKENPVDKISPEVPQEVKESIAEAGKSPEATVNTAAVQDKKEVESELLKEVKEAPAVDDAAPKTTETKAARASSEAQATSGAAANGNGNGAEAKPAGAAVDADKKKKGRLSVIFSKLKAKLK